MYFYGKFKIYFLIIVCSLVLTNPARAGYQKLFTPRISVNTEYSDNLSLSKDNKTEDFITVISPGFTAQILGKTRALTFSYDLGYSSYDKLIENNTLRHNALFSGWIGFTKHTRLDFQNSFILTEESVTEIERTLTETEAATEETEIYALESEKEHEAETETVRRGRESHYTNTTNIGFTHQFGKSDIFNMRYVYSILENEDPSVKDKTNHNPSAGLNYWIIPGQLGVDASVSYTRGEYSATPGKDSYWEESLSPSLGVNYWFIPDRFGIETSFSYSKGEFSDPSDHLNHWHKSLKPYITLTYRSVPLHLETEVTVSRIAGRFSESSEDFNNWYGSLKLTKKFTKHLEGVVRYAHTIMDFKGEGEDYKIYDPSVGINYTLAEGVPLSFTIGYFTRDRLESKNESALSVNGDIGKTWMFSRHGSLSFATSSGYDESYFGAEKLGFGIYYDARCTINYAFTKYFSGNIYGAYRRDKYLDIKENTRNDETREMGSGLIYQKKWLSVMLNYFYRTVESTLSENDYEENRIHLKVILSPFRPIRILD
ncbi:outer membrane beta-barrel protein [Desulfonema magnum]|uniref:Beta-barrel porin type 2 domain-containing protein n=1 Tax=Desulfonema magnum TaxID=45655 RepID=A0A975BHS7_9BACT|nr:outer membrane beta-barrel protein [Desulfonema magnum]QTA85538.1 Putative beta-barrel porin type 2 domain-containing protein [Desulfonema magnum]